MRKARLIIIPAHMGSGRLPGKPLLVTHRKPLIQYVWEQAKKVENSVVMVATDSSKITRAVKKFGGMSVCTPEYPTGTHRVEAVVSRLSETTLANVDSVISWQVDEPLVNPKWVERLFNTLSTVGVEIGTMVAPLEERDRNNPNVVKALVGTGRCEWFSRDYIEGARAHLGIYGFKIPTLKTLGRMKPTAMSVIKGLEQIAWLEAGFSINKIEVDHCPLSINTQEDWNQFVELVENQHCQFKS